MKKYLLGLCWFLVSLSACTFNSTKRPESAIKTKSLLLVEQKGMKQLYDSAKWTMYCIFCDKRVDFAPNLGIRDTITFGMLPLREDTVIFKGIITDMYFSFYYRDSIRCSRVARNVNLSGVRYIASDSNRYLILIDLGVAKETCPFKDCPVREINPLQPEVMKYIRSNVDKIDPWFRQEARRRGVIK